MVTVLGAGLAVVDWQYGSLGLVRTAEDSFIASVSRQVSSQLLQDLGGGTVIGPLLVGMEKPVQVVQMGASVSELVNIAALAAYSAR